MPRQKLALLIGFPLFGILIMGLAELLGSSPILDLLYFVNIIPLAIALIFNLMIEEMPTNIHDYIHDFEVLFYPSVVILFWLPVGYLVNWCLEKYKSRRKQQINHV